MTARILIVDDVPPNVRLLEAKLTKEYFDVLKANSGPEALRIIAREMPDIVLLDVMMPGMDGFEVCRRIKADPATSHIPVVMVTSLDQPADKVAGLEAGADDFLTKPVEDLALQARVKSLARLKMMMDELRNREFTSSLLGVAPRRQGEGEQIQDARILIIHEEGEKAKALADFLKCFGTVTVDHGTDERAELARQRNFDLVIVSLSLPETDGLRIASRIRSYRETRHCPILIIADEGETEQVVRGLDFGVNDYLMRPIDRMELKARVRTQIVRKRSADRLRERFHLSVKLATSDAVTGLHNRHYLTSHLSTLIHKAVQTGRGFALLLLDIDHFKDINDTLGHAAGDDALREFARRITTNMRGIDLAARYGGEEFVVVMPETDSDTAMRIAERLRQSIAAEPFVLLDGNETADITVSIGGALYEKGDTSPDGIIERADDALYAAKRSGRNRVNFNNGAGAVAAEA